MLPNDVNQRASRVMDFINAKSSEMDKVAMQRELDASPDIKMRKLNDEYQKAPSICIDAMLGKMYKNALPFDDPDHYCSDDDARNAVHDFISQRTNGKNSEWYIREALKKNKSGTLQKMLSESQKIARKFYQETAKNIGQINIKDISFNPSSVDNDLNQITSKLEFDDISQIIHNNVQNALQDEADKARIEDEYHKSIENELADNPMVDDDASMESALVKMGYVKPTQVYQPSLMEAIMLAKTKVMTESSTHNEAMNEASREYTKLSMVKALKLERFDARTVRDMANRYMSI